MDKWISLVYHKKLMYTAKLVVVEKLKSPEKPLLSLWGHRLPITSIILYIALNAWMF